MGVILIHSLIFSTLKIKAKNLKTFSTEKIMTKKVEFFSLEKTFINTKKQAH
jgi:hypothetical protein